MSTVTPQDLAGIAAVAGRVCIALVFVTAAMGKMRHWRILEGVVANYRLLPAGLAKPVAALLPPFELVLGVLLLVMPIAALAATGLLLAFAAAMAINLKRGRADIDCGCGQSALRQTLSPFLVGRNIVLALMLVPVLLSTSAPDSVAFAASAAMGAVLFAFYVAANTLSSLPSFPKPMPGAFS